MKNFDLLKSLYGGKTIEQEYDLYAETLYMVLTGASRADLNVESVEISRIIKILKRVLEKDYSEHDIRFAAETQLYETAPIQKYVGKASKHLTVEHRQNIIYAMLDVFEVDGYMGPLETDYFNTITEALHLTPAQILKR
jgi:uncharacterized tellurite resistance protein B-like protein